MQALFKCKLQNILCEDGVHRQPLKLCSWRP